MAEVQHIARGDGTVAYTDTGSGPPIVLGHSFLCSGSMWDAQLPALADRYRVINVDYRGHGKSSALTAPFDLYDLVSDVVAVLDRCAVARAVWAGLSVGGFVSLRAAATHPDRVAGLVLLDTDGGAEPWWPRLKYRLLGAAARRLGLGAVSGAAARQMFGRTTRRRRPEVVAAWTADFLASDVTSLLYFLDALRDRDDLTPRLAGIDRPALVVVGTEDASLPPVRSRRLAGGLPRAELREIPEAGHLSAMEQPEAVTNAMLEFLESLTVEDADGAAAWTAS